MNNQIAININLVLNSFYNCILYNLIFYDALIQYLIYTIYTIKISYISFTDFFNKGLGFGILNSDINVSSQK